MSAAVLHHDDRGAGPAVVLVHGHPFARSMWAPQLAALSDEFRVVAPDLPGYGESPPRAPKMPMAAFAEAVVELLDALEIGRATVVGLSMGGLVAMELALRSPDRVCGVVLAATTAAPVTEQEAERRRALADALERDGMLDHALDMAGRLFGPAARRDPQITGRVLSMMVATDPAGAAAALRGRAERPDYSMLLRDLRVPSMVIAGDHDPYAPEDVTQQLVDALPDPRVVRVEGTGHLPNLEAPRTFDAALRDFARAVDG